MDPILHEDESGIAKYEAAVGEDIYGPEFDLHTSHIGTACKKHPGHKGFVPIKEFTIDHLPVGCPEKKWYFDLLKSLADLVVHISASDVSTERPENFPFFKHRGGWMPKHGSGYVRGVYLCGQDGQEVEMITDVIEKCLKDCKLSALDFMTFHHMSKRWSDSDLFVLRLRLSVGDWLISNVQGSAHDQCRDNFTRDLVHQIRICKDGRNSTGPSTTLNDFRKSRDLSVSDFCVSLSNGVGENGSKSLKAFWEKFAPFFGKPCPCWECHQSGNPKKTWWLVEVKTAAHVVFDHQETERTKVSLFYDDDASKPVTMCGISHPDISSSASIRHNHDSFHFMCPLHDSDSGKRLKSTIESFSSRRYRNPYASLPFTNYGVLAVIAHPHGSTKHLSLGTGWNPSSGPRTENPCKYRHTAPTCPGSSGGPVVRVGDFVQIHSQAVKTDLGKVSFRVHNPHLTRL